MSSTFVISLDFELMWGVRDSRSIADYGANILGVRQAVPAMLATFRSHGVKATWATVGMLMVRNKKELLEHLPSIRPTYRRQGLNPYDSTYLANLGEDERSDPYHFGGSLVELILERQDMELGSHTFSHYYCLEPGQTEAQFSADLRAALGIARLWNVRPVSLVFPRNQFNSSYLSVCSDLGFRSYRGNEAAWIYHAKARDEQSTVQRAARLLDNYVDLTGPNSFRPEPGDHLVNIPASRFLRPYSRKLSCIEPLRLRRITSAMTAAAKEGRCFHLWWHPHNFGTNLSQNIACLEHVLRHFRTLQNKYGMRSLTMAETAEQVVH